MSVSTLLPAGVSTVATLEKPLIRGGVSRWNFVDANGTYFAESSVGKRIDCSGLTDMRRLYARMLTYGFYKI